MTIAVGDYISALTCGFWRAGAGGPVLPEPVVPGLPTTTETFQHYWYDWDTKGFWPDTYQVDHEPTQVSAFTGEGARAAAVLVGGRDGYIRRFRPQHETDDGYEIESYVAYGPIRLGGVDGLEGTLMALDVAAAEEGGNVAWYVCVGPTHEAAWTATPQTTGAAGPGLNYTARPRASGAVLVLKLGNAQLDRGWAIERIGASIAPGGRQRKL